ncbi:MAG: sulfotransferase [Paracoccaceae bacterium]
MIGGTGRSGTNLLKAVLASGPMTAALPFESRFLIDPDGLLPTWRALNQPISPFEAHRHLDRLEKLLRRIERKDLVDVIAIAIEMLIKKLGQGPVNLRTYKEWELEKHAPGFGVATTELFQRLEAGRYGGIWPGRTGWRRHNQNRIPMPMGQKETKQAFSDFVAQFFASLCTQTGANQCVADETFSLFYAAELHQLLPQTRFVHVVRDPRDVVASLLKQRWAPAELLAAIAFYKASMTPIRHTLGQLPEGVATIIRMEDLVTEPQKHLRRLCNYLGIPFADAMTQLDLSRGNIGRWRKELSETDCALLADGLGTEIDHFGYD